MAPRNPKTGRKRIRNREHIAQALELRKAGASFIQIGAQIGLTKQRAFQLVSEGLQELNATCANAAEELRRIELERCDALTLKLWPQSDNPRVCDSILRIMERRAKLLGLDAPAKAEISGADGGPIEVSSLTDAELEAIVMAHQQETNSSKLP
jgi:hypothetical protein